VEVEDFGLGWARADIACVDGGRGGDVLDIVGGGVGSEYGKLRLLEWLRG
jgi:hypothetical protein